MTCPARKEVTKRWWIFSWKWGQPHEMKYIIAWRGMWWNIRWYCVHCGAEHEEWPVRDFELMRKLGLKRMPEKQRYCCVYSKDDLIKQGCFAPPTVDGEKP